MSKAVEILLVSAGALLASNSNNDLLKNAIANLEIAEEPTGNSVEYKELKKVIEDIENGVVEKEEKTTMTNAQLMKDVKMIGSKWYCKKDNYKKGFATAKECGTHFNNKG
jgi:hypothetical protein